jgi:uncharacterized phage protein (TIGR01671 family)
MEEIKFRAWHHEEKKMIIVTKLDFMVNASGSKNEECEGYWGGNNRMKFDINDVTLLQYTGLKDKNGKEIYEGDVIKIEVKKRNKGDFPNLKNYLVVFEDFSFSYKDSEGYYATPLNIFIKGVEVIGNTYENPELLDLRNK